MLDTLVRSRLDEKVCRQQRPLGEGAERGGRQAGWKMREPEAYEADVAVVGHAGSVTHQEVLHMKSHISHGVHIQGIYIYIWITQGVKKSWKPYGVLEAPSLTSTHHVDALQLAGPSPDIS